jgi:HK97 family phage prohead protease
MSNKLFATKDISEAVIDVDKATRTVKAVWSHIGNKDYDNDIIAKGAFDRTIRERGPNGKKMIWSLVDHYSSTKHAFGKPKELYVEGNRLIAVTDIVMTDAGEDILKLYDAGCINQHSIGFSTVVDEYDKANNVRTIKEVILYEGSAVLWGANDLTPTLDVKALTKPQQQKNIYDRLERLKSAIRNGSFTDETFSLLEIEFCQLQKAVSEIEGTKKADEDTPPPVDTKLLEAFMQINQKFKIN